MDAGISEPGGWGDAPPGVDQDGIVRLSTTAGVAAIEVVLDQQSLRSDERLSFRLVNRGQVEVITGQAFDVERWDGHAWVAVPAPSVAGYALAYTDEGWMVGPGGTSLTQRWPFSDTTLATGWYRVVKSARWEGSRVGLSDRELVARAGFRVRGNSLS